jgi:hypothetical protein
MSNSFISGFALFISYVSIPSRSLFPQVQQISICFFILAVSDSPSLSVEDIPDEEGIGVFFCLKPYAFSTLSENIEKKFEYNDL